MKYFVVVGEASGDLHASKLLKHIMIADPKAEIRFWGGDKMADVIGKDAMLSHYKDGAYMGIWEVAKNLKTILGRIKRCKKDIEEFMPDVVVLVDFAGFNMKIAKFAKSLGIKTFYYIAPKVWAWNEKRAKKIAKYVDQLFCIFPFEIEFFKRWGIDAHYFGNPIMEEIEESSKGVIARDEFLKKHKLEDKPIIALLAGSRKQEIEYNLPFMNSVAEKNNDFQYVVAAVEWLDKELYNRIINEKAQNIKVVYNCTYETLLNSEAAIVTSGTATLETALLGVPEVVCYKCSPITFAVGKVLIKIKFISLVNIIMGREVVKELINSDMTTDRVDKEIRKIIEGGEKHDKIKSDYKELYDKMGDSSCSERVARKMVGCLIHNS